MKKMNLKISQLEIILKGLSLVAEFEIESKTSYNISKIIKKISEELELVDKERIKLCEKYSEKDDEGQPIKNEDNTFKISDADNFSREFTDLRNQEVEFEFKLININELPKIIKPGILVMIDELITD